MLATEFFSQVSWANHPITHNQAMAAIGLAVYVEQYSTDNRVYIDNTGWSATNS